MKPWLDVDGVTVFHGDCIDVMRQLPDSSVDAVVTDPPYGLEFMGKEWDSFKTGRSANYAKGGDLHDPNERRGKGGAGPSYVNRPAKRCGECGRQAWSGAPCKCDHPRWVLDNSPLHAYQDWFTAVATEALRVLKPGGHLLAFGGTRTWHRLAVAIEDAGFEIRDNCAWLYGSGFPKSLDVSKAIDKKRDDKQAVARVAQHMLDALQKSGKTRSEIDAHFGTANVSQYWFSPHRNAQIVPADKWPWVRQWLGIGRELDDEVWRLNGRKGKPGEAWGEREVVIEDIRHRSSTAWETKSGMLAAGVQDFSITAPATPAAEQWQGWGTALKPAHEPIVVARKPLIGTVAENVLTHGTGALNIDGCRIGTEQRINPPGSTNPRIAMNDGWRSDAQATTATGRWPANVILDESQAAELDKQSGVSSSASGKQNYKRPESHSWASRKGIFTAGREWEAEGYGDSGGASRFFYVAKASKKERPNVDGIAHPTVKPMALMRYLVRLVTPPGGTVLEPFAGSGTTIEACVIEGFHCIAIEREADYLPLIQARLNRPIQGAM